MFVDREYNLAEDDCVVMCKLSLNYDLLKQTSFWRSKIRDEKPAALKYWCVDSCDIYVAAANCL